VPPIGTGYAPIAGDTAQFAGLNKSIVKSFDGTNWANAVGQVVDGSLIVTGTVTAAQLNTNSVYALTLKGGSVTGPNDTSNVGYWIDAGTGSALFTGNVIVGNLITTTSGITKLAANTVGNANIISGSITATQIAANTIIANNIAAGTITADKLAANVLTVGNIVSFNANLGNITSAGYWLRYDTGDVRFGGNVWIGANLNVTGLINGSTLNANTVGRNNFKDGTLPGVTGDGYLPVTVSVGPGIANWDGVDTTSGITIYYKRLGSYVFNPPANFVSSIGYKINFNATLVATGLTVSGTSGFPSVTFGYNGATNPNNVNFVAGGSNRTQQIYNRSLYGITSFNGPISENLSWATVPSNWSTTGTNYVEVWIIATPSAINTAATMTFTNINYTVTPL
jgi:hypothetical protein